ncbi:hypothetical protein [Jannaschia pohangensis]|uniref:Uncharacterized protein n=1 Tax=Jannaschia pohangensis TaxID=390807 RepID=A0A1I3HZL5_9RHOB|nr:hypothetical protein [Jannaschia pohangensis]SFI41131.1 hypothetical protein SAMN04488095_0761 [Jannaschia pohangensis]
MQTEITFVAPRFQRTSAELDDGAEGYINPGRSARGLSDFLTRGLTDAGVTNFALEDN